MINFPFSLTWGEISELPNAADAFGWDESMLDPTNLDSTLPKTAEYYSTAMNETLTTYLANIGYIVSEDGIIVTNPQAVHTAAAIFGQIMYEYDCDDTLISRIETTRYGFTSETPPTWALFGLGGDDDVDYCGTQPSCLAGLLYNYVKEA